jgi:hypothetical protein
MARRPHPKTPVSRKKTATRAPADLAAARFQQFQSKWQDLGGDDIRRELRRIVGELRLYQFRNKAGPLEQSLPFLELAALGAPATD